MLLSNHAVGFYSLALPKIFEKKKLLTSPHFNDDCVAIFQNTVTNKRDMTIPPRPLCKSGNEQQENPQTLSQGKGSLETREW